MKTKRLLFSILLAALFALLCFGAFAATATLITINQGNGKPQVMLDDANSFLLKNGGTGNLEAAAADPGAAKLAEFKNGTLTLYGDVSIDNSGNTTAINAFEANGDLTVTADAGHPGSALSATAADNGVALSNSYGIYVNGSLTVESGAQVAGTGGNTGGNSSGVYVEMSITITSASVRGEAGEAVALSSGVYAARGNITIRDGASVTGKGGKATASDQSANSYGVYAYDSITASGRATVNGEAGEAYYKSSGVHAENGDVTVRDGASVTGKGDKTAAVEFSSSSHGVCANSTLTASGGATVNGEARDGYINSSGVHSYGSIIVSDKATVSGKGGYAEENSSGIHCNGYIIVSGGASVTGEGGYAVRHSNGIGVYSLTVSGGASVTGEGGEAGKAGGLYGMSKGIDIATNGSFPGTGTSVYALAVSGQSVVIGEGGKANIDSQGIARLGGAITVDGSALFGAATGGARDNISIVSDIDKLWLDGIAIDPQPADEGVNMAAVISRNAWSSLRLPDGTVWRPYSASLVPGGENGFLTRLLGGMIGYLPANSAALPKGLNPNGSRLEGTPEKEGNYEFDGELTMKNGDGISAFKVYTTDGAGGITRDADLKFKIVHSMLVSREPIPVQNAIGPARTFDGSVTLLIVDENGVPVPGARVKVNGQSYTSGADGTLSVPCMGGLTMAVYVTTPQYGEVKVRLSPQSGSVYEVSITGKPEIATAKQQ